MDKYELIDSIIAQIDALDGVYGVERCRLIIDMVSKLNALKGGLRSEEAALMRRIETAESEVRRLSTPPPPGPGEEVIGGQTIDITL